MQHAQVWMRICHQISEHVQSGKQHDALKKRTMDKTLENTLKAGINTKLPTCDAKGVLTDDDDAYRKRK
jgi:hypothetical protein